MRRVAHLSDLHFGRIDPSAVAALQAAIEQLAPDLVVVSGDLTHRARTAQFRAARAFLARLPVPTLAVPGNHDVPLYDVVRRFARPLARYRRFIDADVEPFYEDTEIAVAGVNTARSLTWQGGRIDDRQLAQLRARFAMLDPAVLKVVVTHHPFTVPEGGEQRKVLGRARAAMSVLAECGVDVCLAGHLHLGHAARASDHYLVRRGPLLLLAGTATSTRFRGQANSFNLLRIAHDAIELLRYAWEANRDFEVTRVERFARTADGWAQVDEVRG